MQPAIEKHSNALSKCIKQCWDCRNECQKTLYNYCLNVGHVNEEHIKIMTDCIQICQTAADFMTRHSNLHHEICKACAIICDNCAQSCRKIEDEQMESCAHFCEQCAQSCQAMAKG
ncbi:MAG TPA: four-helix bundle copper-binding protein [Gammaproteobacteria bacterium]|nr:four-helix bundle copper-binding protein [Gammaproteobacteria bacterium]